MINTLLLSSLQTFSVPAFYGAAFSAVYFCLTQQRRSTVNVCKSSLIHYFMVPSDRHNAHALGGRLPHCKLQVHRYGKQHPMFDLRWRVSSPLLMSTERLIRFLENHRKFSSNCEGQKRIYGSFSSIIWWSIRYQYIPSPFPRSTGKAWTIHGVLISWHVATVPFSEKGKMMETWETLRKWSQVNTHTYMQIDNMSWMYVLYIQRHFLKHRYVYIYIYTYTYHLSRSTTGSKGFHY